MSTDPAPVSSLAGWNQNPPPTDGPNSRKRIARGLEPVSRSISPGYVASAARPLSRSLRRVEEGAERKAYPSPSESATPDLACDPQLPPAELRMSLAEWREWEGVAKLEGGGVGDVGLGIGDIERWSSQVQELPSAHDNSLGLTSNATQNYSFPSNPFYAPPALLPHPYDSTASPHSLYSHEPYPPTRPTTSHSNSNGQNQLSPPNPHSYPVTPRKRNASSVSMIDHGSPGESPMSPVREQEILSPVPMSKAEWLRLGGFEEVKHDVHPVERRGNRSVGGQQHSFRISQPPTNQYSFPALPPMEPPRSLIYPPSCLLPRPKPEPMPQWKVQPSPRKSARATGLSVGPIPSTPTKSRATPYPTSSQATADPSAEASPFSSYILNPSPFLPPLPDRTKTHARKKSVGHIPRPRNAFILFRSHAVNSKLIPDKLSDNDHRSVSRIVGEIWRGLPSVERKEWEELAEEEKRQHKLKWPNYKYKPKKKVQLDEEDEEMPATAKSKSPTKKKAAGKVAVEKVKEGHAGARLGEDLLRERERCQMVAQAMLAGEDTATIDARLSRNEQGDYLVNAPSILESPKNYGLPPIPDRLNPSPHRSHRSVVAADSPPSTPFKHSRLARRSPHSSSSSPASNLRYSLPPDASPYPLKQSSARIYGPPIPQPDFSPAYDSQLQQNQAFAMQQLPFIPRNPFDPPAPYSTIYSNENETAPIQISPFNPGFEFDNAPLLAPAYGSNQRKVSIGGRWEQQRGVSRTMTRREMLAQEEEVEGGLVEEVRERGKGKRIASFALDKESFLTEAGLEATGSNSYDWNANQNPTASFASPLKATNNSFLSLTAPMSSKYDKQDFLTPNLNEQHPPRLFHFGSTDLFAAPPTAAPHALFPTTNSRPQRTAKATIRYEEIIEGDGENSTLDVEEGLDGDDDGGSVYSDFNLSVVGEHSFED